MKALNIPLTLLLATSASSMAAVVNFDGLTYEQTLNDLPGWTTSEANTVPNLIAWAEPIGGNMAGAIGGAYAEAANSTFTATYDSSYYGSTINFSLDVLMVDSTSVAPGRDTFSIALYSGTGSSLMSVFFAPAVELGDGVARWEVGYSVNGGAINYTGSTIRENALYDISVDFSGGNFSFTFGNSVDSSNYTGTIAGYDSTTNGLGDIAFSWTKSPSTDFGDNYMMFDNVTVVPEPSVALLSGLAALVMLRRRR